MIFVGYLGIFVGYLGIFAGYMRIYMMDIFVEGYFTISFEGYFGIFRE